jgi:hypothetical protein
MNIERRVKNMTRKQMKRIGVSIGVAMASAGLVFGAVAPAHADPTSTPNDEYVLVSSETVGLGIDCSTVTEQGVQYAIDTQQDICGILSAEAGVVAPFDSVSFNCGEAHIYMYDQAGPSGRAFITWGYEATSQPVWHGLYVSYDGQSNSDTFLDEEWVPPADWEKSDVIFTGNGRASAELTGTVETVLWNCTVLDPSTSALIS